jgi:glucose/arabinose dehydrogenase
VQPRTVPKTTTVGLELVASGMVSPLAMAVPDDNSNRLFIVDQIGQIRIIDANGNLLATPFLDLSSRMVTVGIDFGGGFVYDERGLLGLAFHPGYANNGRFFVFYNAPKGPDQPAFFDCESHISEFHVSANDPNVADPASERILLILGKPQFNHNGGQLAFGPDGDLYLSTGDGGGADDNWAGHTGGSGEAQDDPHPTDALGNAQDKSNLLGKILRIDVNGAQPYAIPSDNPFVQTADARPEVWAYGLRNPWRFSFDPGNGARLFCGDAGQNLFEEVSIIGPGNNYGWHIKEGLHCFDQANPGSPGATCPDVGADNEPLIDPIIEYPHADAQGNPVGIAVIGGYVYRGTAIQGLVGSYVFGDFSTSFQQADGSVFAAEEDTLGAWTMRELTIAGHSSGRIDEFIRGFGVDGGGGLYVFTSDLLAPSGTTGKVYRIIPAP